MVNSKSIEKIKIVMVDHHQLNRESLCFALNCDERLQVIAECKLLAEAFIVAESVQTDIILININDARLSEDDIAEWIKKISRLASVIGISELSQVSFVKTFMACGAKGYLTDNTSREEVIRSIIEVKKGNKYICAEMKNILVRQLFADDGEEIGKQFLTRREFQVIHFIKAGLSSREIAERLMISLHTVQVHRYHILKKMKVRNTASLVNLMSSNDMIYSAAS